MERRKVSESGWAVVGSLVMVGSVGILILVGHTKGYDDGLKAGFASPSALAPVGGKPPCHNRACFNERGVVVSDVDGACSLDCVCVEPPK